MKPNTKHNIIHISILALLFLLVVGFVYIAKEVANTPKRVCHTEETITKGEVSTHEIWTIFNKSYGIYSCRKYLGDEIVCEPGVDILYGNKICTDSIEPKICLITKKEEVCEIK